MKAVKTNIPQISIVVGVDLDGGFSKNGQIPWQLPDDLKRFKQITMGGICIMGRNTYTDMGEMMIGRGVDMEKQTEILPGRESYVITSNQQLQTPGATTAKSIRHVWNSLEETDKRTVFVIGGKRLYIEALAFASTIHMNIIKDVFGCDQFFPVNRINTTYDITSGEETDDLYQVTYNKNLKQHRRQF